MREHASEYNFDISIHERRKDKFMPGLRIGPTHERLCEESINKQIPTLLEIALQKESALKQENPPVYKIAKITDKVKNNIKVFTTVSLIFVYVNN